MAVRFAAGTGPLAELVRQRQDLGTRWHAADQFLIEALSATGKTRSDAAIKSVREELANIERQIADADTKLAKEFPDYSALANPKPLSVAETQALLAPDEVLIAYLIGEKTSYVFAVKREGVQPGRSSTSAQRSSPRQSAPSVPDSTSPPTDWPRCGLRLRGRIATGRQQTPGVSATCFRPLRPRPAGIVPGFLGAFCRRRRRRPLACCFTARINSRSRWSRAAR